MPIGDVDVAPKSGLSAGSQMSRREDPFLEIVEDDDAHGPTETAKRALAKLGTPK